MFGALCAMMDGVAWMLVWSADSWDYLLQVCTFSQAQVASVMVVFVYVTIINLDDH